MTAGWTQDVLKDISIAIPPGSTVDQDSEWTTLYSWTGLPLGPTVFEAEVAGVLPNPRPSDIQARLLRPGGDVTKRQSLTVGPIKAWGAVVTFIEYINDGDQPFRFQLWAKGSGLTVVKVIPKSLNVAAFIAGRIAP